MIAVIGITEVLLARIASRRALDVGEQPLLDVEVFAHGFDDVVGIAHAVGQVGTGAHSRERCGVVAEIDEIGMDALLGSGERRGIGIGQRHLVPGECEHLGDAVAHEAGADHRDACLCSLPGLRGRAGEGAPCRSRWTQD